jgi:formate-dependent nitrite reductase membrane component NrfD
MSAGWILASFALVFAVLIVVRLIRNGGRWDPAVRTWAIIVAIFAIVSVMLLR